MRFARASGLLAGGYALRVRNGVTTLASSLFGGSCVRDLFTGSACLRVDGSPSTFLGFLLAGTALLVAFLNVLSHAFLFARVFGFIASGHFRTSFHATLKSSNSYSVALTVSKSCH